MAADNTTRFSNRVEDYVKYRPGYPTEIIDYLQREEGLTSDKLLADIGAGTGISTALFLEAGYSVVAVEPNKEMREKSIALCSKFPGFKAVDGTAEATNLAAGSVDAIIAGQAFHWFDIQQTKAEFKQRLKKDGLVVLMWNEGLVNTAFEQAYDQLIVQYGKDYVQVDHRHIGRDHIAAFFSPQPFRFKTFDNQQVFNYEGLKGRLLSSSYIPVKGEEGHDPLMEALERLFQQYAVNGSISIHYTTKVYSGKL